MPCRSDYMEATPREVYLSRVVAFLDEVERGIVPDPQQLAGYDGRVYNKVIPPDWADKWVSRLCALCKQVDMRDYSLELQIWWRDHQLVDAKRKVKKRDEERLALLRRQALAKLTREEKKALGLK